MRLHDPLAPSAHSQEKKSLVAWATAGKRSQTPVMCKGGATSHLCPHARKTGSGTAVVTSLPVAQPCSAWPCGLLLSLRPLLQSHAPATTALSTPMQNHLSCWPGSRHQIGTVLASNHIQCNARESLGCHIVADIASPVESTISRPHSQSVTLSPM